MNAGDTQQLSHAAAGKSFFKTPQGALAGAILGASLGAIIGIVLSKSLQLGERTQQMNLTNTGSAPMVVKIDTKRWTGDGEVVIEPGKVGMFIYGEGDELSIFPGTEATGKAHSVTLTRKSILAEANADDDKVLFSYKCE